MGTGVPWGSLNPLAGKALYLKHTMADYLNHCICTFLKRIALEQPGKTFRILEIGGGTGATTEKVLHALKDADVDYLFTDVAAFFIARAKSRFSNFSGIRFGLFDVDEEYRPQGLAPNNFDVVLAAGFWKTPASCLQANHSVFIRAPTK